MRSRPPWCRHRYASADALGEDAEGIVVRDADGENPPDGRLW
jgi:hypothetical protein